MKKHMGTLLWIFSLSCLIFTACTSPASDTDESRMQTDATPSETTAQKADTQQPSPGLMAVFASMEDMRSFVQAAHDGEAAFYAWLDTASFHPSIDSYQEALYYASYMKSIAVPVIHEEQADYSFNAVFYADRNELDMIYDVDNVRYRFIYYFDTPAHADERPVAYAITLDDYAVNLREGELWRVGWISLGEDSMMVGISASAPETAITLEQFDLLPLLAEDE